MKPSKGDVLIINDLCRLTAPQREFANKIGHIYLENERLVIVEFDEGQLQEFNKNQIEKRY